MGAPRAPLGTTMTVCSFTPSRIGMSTLRRTKSHPSSPGVKAAGVSLGNCGYCGPASDGAAADAEARGAGAAGGASGALSPSRTVRDMTSATATRARPSPEKAAMARDSLTGAMLALLQHQRHPEEGP